MSRTRRYTRQQVKAALVESRGFKSVAARKLACQISTITNYIDRYPELQEVLDEAREDMIDRAEIELHHKISPPFDKNGDRIREPDLTAIIFYLKTQAKGRGYVEHADVNLAGSLRFELELPEDFPEDDSSGTST